MLADYQVHALKSFFCSSALQFVSVQAKTNFKSFLEYDLRLREK